MRVRSVNWSRVRTTFLSSSRKSVLEGGMSRSEKRVITQ